MPLGSTLTVLWSQCTGGLCSQVIYIVLMILKWPLQTDGLCSEAVGIHYQTDTSVKSENNQLPVYLSKYSY